MIHSVPVRIYRSFLLLILMLIAISASGQLRLKYEGPLEVAGHAGEAVYFYSPDSVLQGPFEFKSTDLAALLDQTDDYFSIQGSYSDNQAEGTWRFHFGDYSRGEGTTVQNTFYQVSVSGRRHIAEGRLTSGKPDGEFTHTVEVLENSSVVRTPFKSTFNFSRGIPQFSFRIQRDNATLVGRFLRNGQAHDQWELIGGEMAGTLERWHFEEGVLTSIDIVSEGELRSIPIFEGIKNEVIMNFDERCRIIPKGGFNYAGIGG
ncbi:MAG: hypothetical protein P8X57_15105 [Cyclobacteriaceae bacterium]